MGIQFLLIFAKLYLGNQCGQPVPIEPVQAVVFHRHSPSASSGIKRIFRERQRNSNCYYFNYADT